jgi:hypothetical protein
MPDSPRSTQAKIARRAEREARLAGALRDNLRRRKEQARARAADYDTSETAAGPCDRRQGDPGTTG